MNKTISVVIPSYNYEQFIEKAIQSVADQSYKPIELVVVDDCSLDGSFSLLKKIANEERFKKRFTNIVLRQNEKNMGAHYTINDGINHSTGQYISVLNADDLYEPNRFTEMMHQMGNARFSFSAVRCIDEHGLPNLSKEAKQFEGIQALIEDKPFIALSAIGENVSISTGNLLFERDLFLQLCGFKNYKYVHDYDFFLRACLLAEPVFVSTTKYLYRLHGENSFLSLKKEGLRENRMVWLDFYHAVHKGHIENPVILAYPDYKQLFFEAICAAGPKKQKLWNLSMNPLMRAALLFLKIRYKIN